MTHNSMRKIRLSFKFGLLVTLPLAGYVLAQTGISIVSIGLAGAALVMAFVAETLATAAERQLVQAKAEIETKDQALQEEMAKMKESARQTDRIVEALSAQNHDLRYKLGEQHREIVKLQNELAEYKDS